MRLSELLSEQIITVSLLFSDKQRVIEELLDVAMQTGNILNRDDALKDVLAREQLMSTGLERGVAVPHAKTAAVTDLTLALGVSKEGIDFQSIDGELSHLFFFLLAPESAAGPNVKVLAQIARLTSDPEFCKKIINAKIPKEVLDVIRDYE